MKNSSRFCEPRASYHAARGELTRGHFISRPNRFAVICETDEGRIRAYLPNPGRLWELLLPGSMILLEKAPSVQKRSTSYTAVAVETARGPVMLHTHRTNDAAEHLLRAGLVPGWGDLSFLRREAPFGGSRFDFLLDGPDGPVPAEVKSCTLFGEKTAMFPDAPSERARRHVLHLAELGESGPKPKMLFLVQSERMESFLPDFHTDFEFAKALYESRESIDIKAVGVGWDESLSMGAQVSELEIPWPLYERNGIDGGSYLLLLRLDERRRIATGALGERDFAAGYYCYVGSAAKNLKARMQRHLRRRKNFRWHIDYLREHCHVVACLPVRSADPLECGLARAVAAIADGSVPCFGSSDCLCPSHLFRFSSNPLKNRRFISVLLDFRINRLKTPTKATSCAEQHREWPRK
ncbi:MAG: DNA/RNA nuclease SfsA [Thermovirgaceae bacterium]